MPHIHTPHPAGCTCPACAGGAPTTADQARPDDRPGPNSLDGAAFAGASNPENLAPELDKPTAAALRVAEARPA